MADHKRGRPPLDANDASVQVSVTLPARKFDELCERARRQDVSIPEVIRRVLYGNAYTEIKSKK